MRIYELTPGGYDRVKSFYGKAKVIEMFGISGGGKKWWDALPVEESPRAADMTPAESLKAMHARRAANY